MTVPEIVTHTKPDLDGLMAMYKLTHCDGGKIPGINEAEIIYWNGDNTTVPRKNVIFVDTSPENVTNDSHQNVLVFDHHPHVDHPGKTASSYVDVYLGLTDEKSFTLSRWASRSDFHPIKDPMNISLIIKLMHSIYSDQQIQAWTWMIADAHYAVDLEQIDWTKGKDFFASVVQKFLETNNGFIVKDRLTGWLDRMHNAHEDTMNIVYSATINLIINGPEKTKEWITMIIRAVESDRRLFLEAQKAFDEAQKMKFSENTILIIGTTDNVKFTHYTRSQVQKGIMLYILQIQPKTGTFQLSCNRRNKSLADVAAGLRAEILKQRNKEIPKSWQELKRGGTIPGTDPLYYHVGEYQMIFWGTLTRSSVPPIDIEIDTIIRVASITLDTEFFPKDCEGETCVGPSCSLFPWLMAKCNYKRKTQKNKSSNLSFFYFKKLH